MLEFKQTIAGLVFLLLLVSTNTTTNDQAQQQTLQRSQSVLQYNQQRLEQINFLIKSYFANCKLDEDSNLLYGCSIKKQNYAQFLYGLFHKQLVFNFLQLYHIQGKVNQQNQLNFMIDLGDKVHSMAVAAYNDWIQVFKPDSEIPVQQMYQDIPDLDSELLDVIEHNLTKNQDMVDVLKKVNKIKTNYKRYQILANKTEQQIAQDYAGILRVYFGDCSPISKCSMPINRFVHFVKQLSFYITPLIDQNHKQSSILISQQMDFKATEFLIKQIEQLKPILGAQVDYQQIQTYSEDIATNLFSYLKDQQKPSDNTQKVNQAEQTSTNSDESQNQQEL